MGITSICTAYIHWLQFLNREGTDSIIYFKNSKDKQSTKYHLKYNPESFNLTRKEIKHQSASTLNIKDYTSSATYLTTANPQTARNYSPSYVLFTEAAKCVSKVPRTVKRNDRLKNSYQAALPTFPDSLLIMESNPDTAHTQGFFYDTFRNKDGNTFTPLFLPWHADERNIKPLDTNIPTFYSTLNKYETYLFKDLNLSFEQINWYRCKTKSLENPAKLYPSTIAEALTHQLHEADIKKEELKLPIYKESQEPAPPRKQGISRETHSRRPFTITHPKEETILDNYNPPQEPTFQENITYQNYNSSQAGPPG